MEALIRRKGLLKDDVTFPMSAIHVMQASEAAERLLALSPTFTITLFGQADKKVGGGGEFPHLENQPCCFLSR